MPTMPEKAAGWRIEPPVSVPVAARRDARRHRRGRAAGGAARHQVAIVAAPAPGIVHMAVVAGHVGRAHGELVHVELAQHDGAGLPELGRHRRFIGRLEAVEDVGAGGGEHALGAEEILDAERNAFEQPDLAALAPGIGLPGHGERLLRRLGDEGVEAAMALHDREMGLRQLAGAEASLARPARASTMVSSVSSVITPPPSAR